MPANRAALERVASSGSDLDAGARLVAAHAPTSGAKQGLKLVRGGKQSVDSLRASEMHEVSKFWIETQTERE